MLMNIIFPFNTQWYVNRSKNKYMNAFVNVARISLFAFTLIIASCSSVPISPSPEQRAKTAFEEGRYQEALQILRPLAQDGLAWAETHLGMMYHNGFGVPLSYSEAAKWYQRSAAKGDVVAQRRLAYFYVKGQGVDQDYSTAAKWFKKAANQGDAYSQRVLGFMYENGYGVENNMKKAYGWYKQAASKGEAFAKDRLAFYEASVKQNQLEAVLQDGHTRGVVSLSISSSGRYLVSGGLDNVLHVWDISRAPKVRKVRTLKGHLESLSGITSVIIGPNEDFVISTGADGQTKIWDLENGNELYSVGTAGSPSFKGTYIGLIQNNRKQRIDLDSEGRILAVADLDSGTLKIINLLKYEVIKTRELSSDTVDIAFNADNSQLMIFQRTGKVLFFDTIKFAESKSLRLPVNTMSVEKVVANKQKNTVSVLLDKAIIKIIDMDNLQEVDRIKLEWAEPDMIRMALSSVESLVAIDAFCNKTVNIVNYRQKKLVYSIDGLNERPPYSWRPVAFGPSGDLLAVGQPNGDIRLWKLITGKGQLVASIYGARERPASVRYVGKDNILELEFDKSLLHINVSSGVRKIIDKPNNNFDSNYWNYIENDVTAKVDKYDGKIKLKRGEKILEIDNRTAMQKYFDKDVQIQKISLSPWGDLFATGDTKGNLTVWNITNGKRMATLHNEDSIEDITFSKDGKYIASAGRNHGEGNITVKVWSVSNYREIYKYTPSGMSFAGNQKILFDPTVTKIAYVGSDSTSLYVWDLKENKILHSFNNEFGIWAIAFGRKGNLLAVGDESGEIVLWSLESGDRLVNLTGHTGRITALGFNADDSSIISSSVDGTIRFWSTDNSNELASLYDSGRLNEWLVITKKGFFDGTRKTWDQIAFRFTSEPTKLYEPEQFFNQFYQPGLLGEVLSDGISIQEILRLRKDPRANMDISTYRNSKLPEVKILNPPDNTTVAKRQIYITINAKDTGSGLRDLRVFRNQTLIHFEHGDLKPDAKTKTYRLIVPVKLVAGHNEIIAYVFNHDDIKSKDAIVNVNGSDELKRQGRAYILAVGINRYINSGFNLNYAIADTKSLTETLCQSLEKLGTYSKVERIELLDEEATKANMMSALKILSGQLTAAPFKAPTDLKKLRLAEPEDRVIVYFSGHGMAKGDRYFLMPHDLGYNGQPDEMTYADQEVMATHSLSDLELEACFEKINAGNILLIIDACQSGQALEAEEKRRGPMNSRGLAQLAYEKGMYILAAAQSYQDALELERLGHGALTYTLIENGLKEMEADTDPKDHQLTVREWLNYAVVSVPKETEEAYRLLSKRKGGKGIKISKITTTGQAPRAYYRRELVGQDWVIAGP